ncbi:hypothetical protein PQQ51_02890 [Paraburkholderia xenovorans]|uniref:hypothetical protein n=1 Tax=Paraburkholderia xenovorans TaxID=36873 RepID=UPI0038B7F834
MNRISKPAAIGLDRRAAQRDEVHGDIRVKHTRNDSISWQRCHAAPRALFATPPVDLQTLVIADAIKRKAQQELQREALRDAMYEIPASSERDRERGADIQPFDPDDCT